MIHDRYAPPQQRHACRWEQGGMVPWVGCSVCDRLRRRVLRPSSGPRQPDPCRSCSVGGPKVRSSFRDLHLTESRKGGRCHHDFEGSHLPYGLTNGGHSGSHFSYPRSSGHMIIMYSGQQPSRGITPPCRSATWPYGTRTSHNAVRRWMTTASRTDKDACFRSNRRPEYPARRGRSTTHLRRRWHHHPP